MHKQYDLKLFSGAHIQLKHCYTNEYLFSNQIKLTSGSKSTMLGCTKNNLQEGTKFEIHLAYTDFGDMAYQPIIFGDLVYLKQLDQIVQINTNNKSQTTNQKEAVLVAQPNIIQGSQIFVVTPLETGADQIQKISTEEIKQAQAIRLVNMVSTLSLHSHPNFYKQKNLQDYREVTGFSERDQNDDWLLNIHEINLLNGMVKLQPRFQREIHHGDSIIIRNAFLGTTLHSHQVYYKAKQQEVSNSLALPRDRNDLWQMVLYKNDAQNKTEIITDLQFTSSFSLLHVNTNQMLTHLFGSTNSDKTLQICCTEDQLKFEEWSLLPVSQKQVGLVYCNQFFLIRHNPTQHYLTSIQKPSSPTKFQYITFLSPQPSNASVWAIEATLS